jgi:hypothetical protein
LKDPRTGNASLHDLHELLVIALCTVLSGGQGTTHMAAFAVAKEPFLRGLLKLANGLPSHDTFSRLFRLPDPCAAEQTSSSPRRHLQADILTTSSTDDMPVDAAGDALVRPARIAIHTSGKRTRRDRLVDAYQSASCRGDRYQGASID